MFPRANALGLALIRMIFLNPNGSAALGFSKFGSTGMWLI